MRIALKIWLCFSLLTGEVAFCQTSRYNGTASKQDVREVPNEKKPTSYSEKYLSEFLNRRVIHKKYRDRMIGGWLGAAIALSIQDKSVNGPLYSKYQIKNFSRDQINRGVRHPLYLTAGVNVRMASRNFGTDAEAIKKDLSLGNYEVNNKYALTINNIKQGKSFPDNGIESAKQGNENLEGLFTIGVLGSHAPGMPQAAAELAFRVGSQYLIGEELQAAILASVFLSETYSSDSVFQAFNEALKCLPSNSPLLKPLQELGTYCNKTQDSTALLKKWEDINSKYSTALVGYQGRVYKWMGSNLIGLCIADKNFVKALKVIEQLNPGDVEALAMTGFLAGGEIGLLAMPDSLIHDLDRDKVIIPGINWNFDSLIAVSEKNAWQVHSIAGSFTELVGLAKVMKMPNKACEPFPLLKDYTPGAACRVNISSVKEYIADLRAVVPVGYKSLWLLGNFKSETGTELNYLYPKTGNWQGILLVFNDKGQFNYCRFEVKTAPDYYQKSELKFNSKMASNN